MKFSVSNKVYAHIDCNSFFASCEVLREPSLAGKCVCVGNEIIIAATYEAKKLGIKTGTPIWEAKAILGERGTFLSPDHIWYSEVSKMFMDFLRENSMEIQIFSIDEAFIDITGLDKLYKKSYSEFAHDFKERIKNEIGISVSIGVSNTRIRAKIFSEINKPFGEFIGLTDIEVEDIFMKLSISDIPFIGRKLQEKLKYLAKTVDDYRKLPFWQLKELIGKNATDLWLELNGVDTLKRIGGEGEMKSISRTRSFNREMTTDKDKIWFKLISNFEMAYSELMKNNFEIRSIGLYFRDKQMRKYLYEGKFEEYTNSKKMLLDSLKKIFDHHFTEGIIYRSTGVVFSNFQKTTPKQLSLFQSNNEIYDKNKKIAESIADINNRFGKSMITIGSNLK
ncbi:MAG: DNA polymerase IV [Candidatus Gracilibacteria bacterium]|nr:DNA polymerase IV [Candidatus Gracilibacteria bacterium]